MRSSGSFSRAHLWVRRHRSWRCGAQPVGISATWLRSFRLRSLHTRGGFSDSERATALHFLKKNIIVPSETIIMSSIQKTPIVGSFSIEKAARYSGLKRPMVDYLCRQKILEPTFPRDRGRGRQRQYTFGDVVMLRAIAKLLAKGISVKRLKDGLVALRQHHPEITPNSLPASHIVTDGETVFLRRNEDTIEALDTTGQMVFAFVLELGRIRDEVIELASAREGG